MIRALAVLFSTGLLCFQVVSAEVVQVRWPTRLAAPPLILQKPIADWLPTFRLALGSLPEEAVVAASLTQGPMLGLPVADASKLQKLFADYYLRVRQSAAFKSVPSSLPYCFSESQPEEGLATICVPTKLSDQTEVIIFLHGFGGSLLVYPHYFAETFPDHIIICPAYGISPAEVSPVYLAEALQAATKRIGVKLRKPHLIGLSAGGFGAYRAYVQEPNRFSSITCLGAYPPADSVARTTKQARARFFCGELEPFVKDGSFLRQMSALRARASNPEWKLIKGADHYFLLSHEQQTKELLREYAN